MAEQEEFCMQQFKPVILVICVLAVGTIAWTWHEASTNKGGLQDLAGETLQTIATAPPIRIGPFTSPADVRCSAWLRGTGSPDDQRLAIFGECNGPGIGKPAVHVIKQDGVVQREVGYTNNAEGIG